VDQDFKEVLSTLNDEHVRYLVVGGYAVIMHTEPRYTRDLDIWVSPDRENAERVFRALQTFGAPLTGLSVKDFTEKGYFYTMGLAPSRVDILFDLKGLEFDECYKRRIESDFGGVVVHIIGARDLIVNKEAVGRHQDLADAEKLRIALQRSVP
jgi:predicted nucleotidyltransferase